MSKDHNEVFTYLLVDNGQLQEISAGYAEADSKSRPPWLEPIYSERALEVSPLLIDVEAAHGAGDIEQVMRYLNARRPALHVSIIESEFDLAGAAQHLRRFIFILDPEGKQFTLRFADCVVLEQLSVLLTRAQWATVRGPFARWGVHDRSGSIVQLQSSNESTLVRTPLALGQQQLTELDEASESDHLIAMVKMIYQGREFPGNAVEQHTWVRNVCQIWRAQKKSNPLILEALAEAALITRGEILRIDDIKYFLETYHADNFRERLSKVVCEFKSCSKG